jgi:hypothetical protein
MKIVNVIKNYLPLNECDELNTWVRNAIANDLMTQAVTTQGSYKDANREKTPLRYTTRFSADKFEYPQLVKDIHARIEADCNLTQWHNPVHWECKDATVVSATLPDGDVYLHMDGKNGQTLETLRCNILTSETEGGLIHVGNETYQLKKGDMMQYLVSRHEHKVETVIGNEGDMRILWMFGWCVDGDEWEASIQ